MKHTHLRLNMRDKKGKERRGILLLQRDDAAPREEEARVFFGRREEGERGLLTLGEWSLSVQPASGFLTIRSAEETV